MPATSTTAATHTHITSIVPRSFCSITSAIGTAGERERDREPPGVEIAPMLMAVARERDDQHDLRDLRRLELQRPELEPRRCVSLRPVPTNRTARSSGSVAM